MKTNALRIKDLIFILLGIYIIIPDYFTILGINSSYVLAGIIVLLYAMTHRRIYVDKRILIYAILVFFPLLISYLFHANWTGIVINFVERVVLVYILYSLIDGEEDMLGIINIVLVMAILECIIAILHFLLDFNLFSLLSNTTDSAVIGANTQYRNGLPRVEGSFGHSITFAVYLSICACLALYMHNKQMGKRYLVCYWMMVVSLVLAGSRIPIMIFGIVQLGYLLALGWERALKIISVLAVVIMIGSISVYIFVPQLFDSIATILKMIPELFSIENLKGIFIYNDQSPFSYRFEMMRVIPAQMKGDWLMGLGKEVSTFVFRIGEHNQKSIDNHYLYSYVVSGVFGVLGALAWIFGIELLDKRQLPKKKKSFKYFRRMIVLVYGLNLFSVAEMSEHRLWVVFMAVSLAELFKMNNNYRKRRNE